MVQTRLNSGLIEDPALGQVLKGDNGSAEGSSRRTISKVLQRPTGGNALPVSEGMQLPDCQEALKNSSAMSTKGPIKVDASLGNKESGGEDEIAAEIEWLKKEQKKTQMRTKLRCLREHKAQRFVKNIPK